MKILNSNKLEALVVGASGLIGSECLQMLVANERYARITVITRSALEFQHPKLNSVIIKFEELYNHSALFNVDDVYCCLGTTMKKAGSKTRFMKVDYEYVMNVAKLSEENGVKAFNVVSAVGADVDSKIFYNHVKGRVEQDLAVNKIHSISIFRPSLLLGKRQEFRFAERIGMFFGGLTAFLFVGPFKKYRPISASVVAKAMISASLQKKEGIHVYEYPQMLSLVNR